MKELMRRGYLVLIGFSVSFIASAGVNLEKKDTVIIKFGNNSRIVIYVSNQDDLEKIKRYDINAMLNDLNLSIDTTGNEQYLEIEDSSGTRYLKDTTVYIDEDEAVVQEYEDEEIEEDEDMEDDEEIEEEEDAEPMDRNIRKNYGFKEQKKSKNYDHRFKFDLGMNNYLQSGKFPDSNNELYTVKPWGSWYVGLNSIHSFHIAGPLRLETGGGLSWYNFKFQNASTQISQTEMGLDFYDSIPGKKSKLTASYINVHFVPVFNFGRSTYVEADGVKVKKYNNNGFRIGFGAYGGYRIGSHTKFVHSNDKKKDKDRDNFYLNNWRYGARLQVGFDDIDFFINYDLNDLFAEGKGPQLNAFSFGVTF